MQLSTFRTYVKRDFKRTDKDTEIDQAYNDMIIWVAQKMPHGNYKFQSYISTVNAQEDYPLPTNLIHLIHPIKYLEGSAANDWGWPLDHITKEEYDLREPNPNRTSPSTGKPTAYTIFSRSILLTPIPDNSADLLEISWAKRATTLSAATDVPDLGSEWDEIFKFGTLERVYDGMGMLQEAQYWGSKYHILNPVNGDDAPIGLCKKLFDAERDREIPAIGQVKFNEL